jgi:hypothetical protein
MRREDSLETTQGEMTPALSFAVLKTRSSVVKWKKAKAKVRRVMSYILGSTPSVQQFAWNREGRKIKGDKRSMDATGVIEAVTGNR